MAEVELPNLEEVEEKKASKFARRVGLVVACYAVALAITSLGGNNAAKDMMLSQQQASNQWSYYQAKAIREHEYRIAKLHLDLEIAERSASMAGAVREKAQTLLKNFADEELRYGKEKDDIKKEAEVLEKKRDEARAKDPYFDYAEVLLQIAIVVASIAMLADSPPMFGLSVVLAAAGVFLSADGFFMFLRVPFLGE